MLSKNDIIRELGKNILIAPFSSDNLKENSYNLTTSKYTWCDGASAIVEKDGKNVIRLQPHATTIVYSEEIVHVGQKLGGAVHSKVGIVAKNIGHIGTMFGPNYKGRFLIMLHNISDKEEFLDVGESFCSLTFDYLKTKYREDNKTAPGHTDILSKLRFPEEDFEGYEEDLTADWIKDKKEILKRMKTCSSYKEDVEVKKIKRNNSITLEEEYFF